MTQSTEQERTEFEKWWSSPHIWGRGHKEAQWASWQAARRAPAVPVPRFNHAAKRKLELLTGEGATITGYAFQSEGRRGSIDCHGFVAWFPEPAAAPQPPEAALVPSIAVTPEMVEAANEAYCPFGDMELALCAALQVAPIPPGAAPVPQGWKLVPVELLDRATESLGSFVSDHGWGQADMDTFDDLSALAAAQKPPEAAPVQLPCADDFSNQLAALRDLFPIPAYGSEHEARWMASISDPAEVLAYVTEQVRQLLAAHGINEQST